MPDLGSKRPPVEELAPSEERKKKKKKKKSTEGITPPDVSGGDVELSAERAEVPALQQKKKKKKKKDKEGTTSLGVSRGDVDLSVETAAVSPLPENTPATRLSAMPSEQASALDATTPAEPLDAAAPQYNMQTPPAGYDPIEIPHAFTDTAFDPERHEIWLMQLPHDWQLDEEVTVLVKEDGAAEELGTGIDQFRQRYTLWDEAGAFAKPLYVLDASEEGTCVRAVQRRITVVRDRAGGEDTAPPVLSSIPLEGDAVGAGEKALELADIVEIPTSEEKQQHNKKKRKKEKGKKDKSTTPAT